jgi:two-component system OmpR family sensor kinase/two-component system sensor histidine kinase QseC
LRVLADAVGRANDEVDRSRTLRELVHSVDHCAHLQEQLLTLSRLDVSKGGELNQEVELTEVVDEVMQGLLADARRGLVKVASHMDGSAIRGNRFGVLTLIRNVVGNAVRYTPAGGRVEISSAIMGSSAFVQVDDSGPGIPVSERERVFERFERLHSDLSTGVGLGLSIVRTVATAHDATVTLADSPLGGLRVVIEFKGRAIQRLPMYEDSQADHV